MNNNFNLLSFSTSWNGQRYNSGEELVYQIKKMGFNKIELNYELCNYR